MGLNLNLGRVDPVLERLSGFEQPGQYLCDTLPIKVPAAGGAFKGRIVTRPLANAFADQRSADPNRTRRSEGAEYPKAAPVGPDVETPYECVIHDDSVMIDEAFIRHYGDGADAEIQQRVNAAWNGIKGGKERQLVDKLFDVGAYPHADITDLPGCIPINSPASSLYALGTAVANAVRAASGQALGYVVVSRDVALAMLAHAETMKTIGDPSAGIVVVGDRPSLSQMLSGWAVKWGVSAIYVQDVMIMDGGSLTELTSGQLAFHTFRGVSGAYRNGNDTKLVAGAASLVIAEEKPEYMEQSQETNPKGTLFVIHSSYGMCAPSNMDVTAFIVSGALG